MILLVRKETFSAAHRLHNSECSDEWNEKTFGKCNNLNGHGHNYTLEVFVKGEIDPKLGAIINLTDLEAIIKETILDQVDHKNLDYDVPFLKGKISTLENVVTAFWQQLEKNLPKGSLYKLVLHETDKNRVEYYQ